MTNLSGPGRGRFWYLVRTSLHVGDTVEFLDPYGGGGGGLKIVGTISAA